MSLKRAFMLGFLLAFIGQVATAQDDSAEPDEAKEQICVNTRIVRSFDALTDQYVYVKEGSDKHYLFTMRTRCLNLRDAMGIAFKESVGSRICADGFGEIVYRNRFGGRRLESCPIGTIDRVESKEDAAAIVAALTAKQDDE